MRIKRKFCCATLSSLPCPPLFSEKPVRLVALLEGPSGSCRGATPLPAALPPVPSRRHGSHVSIVLNEHFDEDGAAVYRAACQLGCEGIVSKRLGSLYRSGRSRHWVKVKNPKALAVKREAEEDWGRLAISRGRKAH